MKTEELDAKIEKLYLITDNIQTNYLNITSEIKEINKNINTIMIKIATLENDICWLNKLKNPFIIIGSGTGIGSLIYFLYEFMKK
ncbi:MAG: hypothetical protein QW474_01100 [Candidatus Aenigmatarchaeota archaeon]